MVNAPLLAYGDGSGSGEEDSSSSDGFAALASYKDSKFLSHFAAERKKGMISTSVKKT